MTKFDRGLDDDFVAALNREYEQNTWWRQLVDDRELFVALRKNSVNVYFRGGSLAKLSWKAGQIVGEIHYKYLLRSSIPKSYIDIVDGRILIGNAENMLVRDLSDTENIKKAASPYAGLEKTGVHRILASNPNVVDVEIAFGIPGTDEDNPSAPRIDFAALQSAIDDEGVKIVFFEAKHFGNRNALRSGSGSKPKVVKQIQQYSDLLVERRRDIIKSYRRVCDNLLNLSGMAERYPSRQAMFNDIVTSRIKLDVDENPVLVVFGFDSDQRDGKNWQFHRDVLEAELGRAKVQFRGDADGFVRGISV